MKARKILVSVAALALVAAISIGGTLAYLTSKTNTVKNVFTVGNVHIKLDEALVDGNGKKLNPEQRTTENNQGNKYNLMPNHVYDKDPTVTVLAHSEEAFVRMLVTVTFDRDLELQKAENEVTRKLLNDALTNPGAIFTGGSKNWELQENNDAVGTVTVDGKAYTQLVLEYRYSTTVANNTDSDSPLPALFTKVEVPTDWDNEQLNAIGGFTIDIVAEAIQADGFEDTVENGVVTVKAADKAWAAFDEQYA